MPCPRPCPWPPPLPLATAPAPDRRRCPRPPPLLPPTAAAAPDRRGCSRRYGSGINIDFFLYSPTATVRVQDCVRKRLACTPESVNPASVTGLPRPAGFPGQQSASRLGGDTCVRGMCSTDVLLYEDVAVQSSSSGEQVVYALAWRCMEGGKTHSSQSMKSDPRCFGIFVMGGGYGFVFMGHSGSFVLAGG